jgi:hypothetical protein
VKEGGEPAPAAAEKGECGAGAIAALSNAETRPPTGSSDTPEEDSPPSNQSGPLPLLAL